MAELIVATLNVTYDSEDSSTSEGLKLEIDDREDGLNGGETSFKPGDEAYYFMFIAPSVELVSHEVTAKGFTSAGTGTKAIDENISFSNSNTATLSYPPDGAVERTWLGKAFVINTDGTTSPYSSTPNLDEMELSTPDGKNVAGVLNCKYNSTGQLFKLNGEPTDILEVMVIAIGLPKVV